MKTRISFSPFPTARRLVCGSLCGVALLGVASATIVPAQAAKAAKKQVETGLAPWAGRRVLFLTPLQLGADWNADVNFGRAILPSAERMLHDALQSTGKFSVEEPRVFSPLIQRGLQEKRLDETLVTKAVIGEGGNAPGVQDVAALAGQFVFDSPSMVANFRLEEVRGGGTDQRPTVQVVVSSQLYEVRDGRLNPQPFKSLRVTSDAMSGGRSNIERFSFAAENAFQQTAAAFVAPIQDVQFARPAASTTPRPKPDAITNPKNAGSKKMTGANSGGGMVQEVPAPPLPVIDPATEPTTPDTTPPDETTMTEETVPDVAVPDETVPEVVVPEENAPDAAAPPVDGAAGGPL